MWLQIFPIPMTFDLWLSYTSRDHENSQLNPVIELASVFSVLRTYPASLSSVSFIMVWWSETEKAKATHSSALAWKIPWTEEAGGLQFMGLQRVGHNWLTSLSLFTFMPWRRKWQPTPVFLPVESQGRGAWWAAVYGVAQLDTAEVT